jgi:hypothetical protein
MDTGAPMPMQGPPQPKVRPVPLSVCASTKIDFLPSSSFPFKLYDKQPPKPPKLPRDRKYGGEDSRAKYKTAVRPLLAFFSSSSSEALSFEKFGTFERSEPETLWFTCATE